jgi:transposase InsO family protein
MGCSENGGTKVNRKAVGRVLRNNILSLPYAKHKDRTKQRNLFGPTGSDSLWETDTAYIPTQQGMTYLIGIKDGFTKEWKGLNYSRSWLATDAVMSLEDAVLRSSDGETPEAVVLRMDNGNIESFHNSLKTDYIWPFKFADCNESSVAIEKALKDYNEFRPRSSIDYQPPRESRRRFLEDQSLR